MSRFKKVDTTRLEACHKEFGNQGANIPNIMWHGNYDDEQLGMSIDRIATARTWIRKAEMSVRADNKMMRLFAWIYLGSGNGLDKLPEKDSQKIQSVLARTKAGLDSSFPIKLGEDRQDSQGSVTVHTWGEHMEDKKGYPKDFVENYHSKVIPMDAKNINQEAAYGAIHISSSRMQDGQMGPKTIIHEATHKFAGTSDYFLWRDDGKDVNSAYKAFLYEDGYPRAEKDTIAWKEFSMKNADSFAWFVKALGNTPI